MKKNWETKLTVKRTSTSPYFSSTFNQDESDALAPYAQMLSSEASTLSDILITNTHTNFESLSIDQIEKLKLVIHPNSGHDNISLDFAKGLKAPIIIGSAIRAQAVAQYNLSALMQHFSQIEHKPSWDYNRKWPRKLISDLKITIIGFGHIGKILHAALTPIAKEICVYDPFENLSILNHKNSDVVILACSLNAKNKHMLDKVFFNALKEDALIINTSRGELIKTGDLVNFLAANDQAFAVLDVFEEEPNDFLAFKNLTNIKLTSHVAGVYKNIDQHTILFEVMVLEDFLTLTDFDFKNKYQKMILQNKIRPGIGII